MGSNAGASGTYNLSGGSLSATNEVIGLFGTGTFTQTGGTNTVGLNLNVGTSTGHGTYALLGGSVTVGGAYTQGANGTFMPGISSPTNFASLQAGTASLNGTVSPVLQGGYIPAINQLFHGVITTTGGVTGTFSTVANQFITPILSWEPIYTPTTFDLLVKGNFASSGLGLSLNQQAVGNMLNTVAPGATGDLETVLNTHTTHFLPWGARPCVGTFPVA